MTVEKSLLSQRGLLANSSDLQSAAVGGVPDIRPELAQSVERFEEALRAAQAPGESQLGGASRRQVNIEPDGAVAVEGLTYGKINSRMGNLAVPPVDAGHEVASLERGRQIDTRGSAILSGISNLREIFDHQVAKIDALSSSSIVSSEQLLSAQVEIAKFSLLMDVTSKLTGKSTQVMDTLMKGQ